MGAFRRLMTKIEMFYFKIEKKKKEKNLLKTTTK